VHDEDGDGLALLAGSDADDDDDEGGYEGDEPPYPVLALLLRTRLETLPTPPRTDGASGHAHAELGPDSIQGALAGLFGGEQGGPGAFGAMGRPGRPSVAPMRLPAKRKKADGPAPVYQVKVGLRGARPPIWRRLLIPADVSLARLHDIVQAAFGWEGGHLHVFDTAYGEFGQADRELGHRAEAPVTLEQVAPQVKDRIRYIYDFGDDWDHEILVEGIYDRDPHTDYPWCTGGRRMAPPDDCGGIWGYQELIEILGDPEHPEHDERLEWLGLDDAGQFDPTAFDADEVNRALAALRHR